MNIFVINTGSSSIKYKLFDMANDRAIASGLAEKIGEADGMLTHEVTEDKGRPWKKSTERDIPDHRQGLNLIVDSLVHPEYGVIGDKSEIWAVGHRVVHGGEAFKASIIIDERVIAAIRENIPLAPLHNPANLTGIEVAQAIFPDSPQVAVFDTAFHQTIPKKAFLYALPYDLYEKEGVRRYGFHGTSHSYVSEKSAEYLNQPLSKLNLITIHLGNGASMAAIRRGKSTDTTMGLTPLEGLVMGTRSGDVDPALPFFLADHLKMSLGQIDTLLNKESGLKGLCGINDMREVLQKAASGNEAATVAMEVYCYRIRKYIGGFFAVLEYLDGLVFTGGIGENAPEIRRLCCQGLAGLGIELDTERNRNTSKEIREIGSSNSRIRLLVVPTNEELKIAQETKKVVRESRGH
jgi:acetate kinase